MLSVDTFCSAVRAERQITVKIKIFLDFLFIYIPLYVIIALIRRSKRLKARDDPAEDSLKSRSNITLRRMKNA